MNPCPCGYLGAFAATGRACRCTPDAVQRYQGKLSGPLLDRIDLQVEVPAVKPAELMAAADGEPSADVAERVAAARQRAAAAARARRTPRSTPAQIDTVCAHRRRGRGLPAHAPPNGWAGRAAACTAR